MGIGIHSYHLNICPSDNHPVTQIICYIVVLKVLKKLCPTQDAQAAKSLRKFFKV